MPTASPIDISSANSRTTVQIVPLSDVANSIIPIISAMPTGSFAPDSASRIVPVRPETSRRPSTENMTAGSVGAIAAPISPDVIHEKSSSQCAASVDQTGGRERSEDAEREDGNRGGAEPAQADPRAAVEEDHDEGDDADPLDGADRDVSERGKGVRKQRRGDQEQGRPGNPKPLAQPARHDREREPGRDEEHDQSEVVDLVHSLTLSHCRGPYISLTFR